MTGAQPTSQLKGVKRHRVAVAVLVVAGTLTAFLAIAAIWINRQVMDTTNWTNTSSQMLEDPAIRAATSAYLVDQLYANADVSGQIRSALPTRAEPLAGPIAGAVRNLAEDITNRLLQRPRVQELWKSSNRAAHKTFLKIVKGGGPAVSTEGGVVKLDLRQTLLQLEQRTGVGGGLASKLPADAAQLTVMRSDQLSFAQDVANALRPLAILLVVLMLACFGVAIRLAHGHRRETVRAAGFGLIIAGALALLLRSQGGGAVVNSLTSTDAARPAVESVWRIGTSLLVEAATATIAYGIVIVFAAWLAGPTRAAVASRRGLAPFLREPRYAWGGAALIVLLVLLWGPTPGTRKLAPALLLIGLFVLGVAALRRQTAREFPDARTEGIGPAILHGWERLRGTPAEARPAGNGHRAPQDGDAVTDPVVRLERLVALRDRGVLTQEEFAEQKREILAPG